MTRDATSGSRTTKAARLLLMEAAAIEPILLSVDSAAFDLPTVCDGWSVRDVVAHCGAALTRTASGDLHQFTQADNQADVDARRDRPVDEVISELIDGYLAAAASIDRADGRLDGIALGEWIHGGDIRDALGLAGAYASEGIHLALDLLVERSERMGKPAVVVRLPDRALSFGAGTAMGTLASDTATFVRICGGRRPDPDRYAIDGTFTIEDLVLFS
jgi:uncharacterized protein (TIGR03083 family)